MRWLDPLTTAWRKSFDFKGKTDRLTYWMFAFQSLLASILLFALAACIPLDFLWARWIILTPVFAQSIPYFSISIRRIRDSTGSGWNTLWILLPIVGNLVLLFFYLMPSQIA